MKTHGLHWMAWTIMVLSVLLNIGQASGYVQIGQPYSVPIVDEVTP